MDCRSDVNSEKEFRTTGIALKVLYQEEAISIIVSNGFVSSYMKPFILQMINSNTFYRNVFNVLLI